MLTVAACGGGSQAASSNATAISNGVLSQVDHIVARDRAMPTFHPPGPRVDVGNLKGKRIFLIQEIPNDFNSVIQTAMKSIADRAGVRITSGAADPSSVTTLLLPAFAAAFLGATTVSPGRFTAWGCLVAVYFLVTGITGLQLLGAQTYVQDLFYGGALIVAVALSQLSRSRLRSGSRS
jgi:hypothetical protein